MKNNIRFVSGNEAVAIGVGLCNPGVIAAYPITPQTIVVERLSEMVESGTLKSEFLHVESEHSAITASMGASSVGARTFTATSSQGLVYMAEGLHYASGGRFPVVMMNACRSLALPWSIFGDHRDSLSLLDSGWIQVYVEDAQEALDMVIQAFKIAEDERVMSPFMINLDGFILTHTYEVVEIPEQKLVDQFLPEFNTTSKMSLSRPMNMGFSTSPNDNQEFKYQQHKAMTDSAAVISDVSEDFEDIFGRGHGGLIESYRCNDADVVLITLGSVTGTVRIVVDKLREAGEKVGLLKIRFMRPFPASELREALQEVKSVGVIDKDISFGYEGTVFTNVKSALMKVERKPRIFNFIGGLGGRDISKDDIEQIFSKLFESVNDELSDSVNFINMRCGINE